MTDGIHCPRHPTVNIGLEWISYLNLQRKRSNGVKPFRTGGNVDINSLSDVDLTKMKTDKIETPARILVVDDEELNCFLLVSVLEQEGYEVLEAGNGHEALEIISNTPIDLVLLDVVMPEMDGFETCSHIRTKLGNLTLPVIFTTGLHDRNSRVKGKEAGGDDFLTKPVDSVELVVRVRNLLKTKAYHDLKERQKEALEEELERTRKQLLHADRLATLGTLAGGVGHELQNVYGVFSATLDFIKSNVQQGKLPDEEDLENLETVKKHLRTHATQLLNMGRPGPEHEGSLDLRDVVTATLSMLAVAGKTKRVQVQHRMPDAPVPVTVNRTRIEQVLINLVGNSVDALFEDGKTDGIIRIDVEAFHDNARVLCRVENNGPSIPDSLRETIFEPYFSTKQSRGGTGLGLSVVKHIVESYGGTVTVAERVGGGAVFEFDLPRQA